MAAPLTTTVTTQRLTITERARESVRELVRQDREQTEIMRYESGLSSRNGEAEERIQELAEQAEFFIERVKVLEAGLEVTGPARALPQTPPRPAQPQAQSPQKRSA